MYDLQQPHDAMSWRLGAHAQVSCNRSCTWAILSLYSYCCNSWMVCTDGPLLSTRLLRVEPETTFQRTFMHWKYWDGFSWTWGRGIHNGGLSPHKRTSKLDIRRRQPFLHQMRVTVSSIDSSTSKLDKQLIRKHSECTKRGTQ